MHRTCPAGRTLGRFLKKIISQNKKARHDYNIEKTYETGIALTGTEIKSVRSRKVSIKESFARVKGGEVFLHNMNITPLQTGDLRTFEATRPRKLLLHKREIRHLIGKIQERGFTLIPISLYFKNSLVKVELGLGKGKKLHDKRRQIAKKTADREIERAIKDTQRGRS